MEKILSIFRNHKKQIVLGGILVLALSIPIVIAQVLKQQDVRQHAAAGDPVTLTLVASPASLQKNVNDTFDVQLHVNTNTNDVVGIQGYLKYDDTKLQLVSKTGGETFTETDGALTDFTPTTGGHAKVQEIFLNSLPATPITGADKTAVTFSFKALAAGTSNVFFGTVDSTRSLLVSAAGFSTNIPITNASGQPTLTFTIGTGTTSNTCTTTPGSAGCTCSTAAGGQQCIAGLTCTNGTCQTSTTDQNLDTTLTAPTNLQPNGNIIPGSTTLTWTASAQSTGGYVIKITDDAVANQQDMKDDCTNSSPTNTLPTTGGVCRIVASGTSYQYNFTSGHHYHWFVHTRSSAGKYGNPANAAVYADSNGDASLTAPTNLKPSGTINAGLTTLTWDASTKATGGYYIRVSDTSSPNLADLSADCANQKVNDTALPTTGGVCRITPSTSYSYNFQAGHSYVWFVHSRGTDGKFGPASINANVTATVATAVSPSPTVDACTAVHNKTLTCTCTADTDCRSTLCSADKKCAPRPTQAVPAGNTGLTFSVSLPAIAQKLDNNEDNPNPINSSRMADIKVFDATNTEVTQPNSKRSFVFNPATFRYEGAIDLGTTIATGNFTVKIGFDNTLLKWVRAGIVNITQAKADNAMPPVALVPGDVNHDTKIDILDWNIFMACYFQTATCTPDLFEMADLNDNGQIDIGDQQILYRGFQERIGD